MKVPKQLRVGVPMVGVVLIGYLSLSSVLQGRIQVRDLPSEPTLLFSPFWWGSSDSLSLSLCRARPGAKDYDSRTLNDTPKIPDSKKNKGKIDLGEEVQVSCSSVPRCCECGANRPTLPPQLQRARDVVEDEYELKSTRRS